MRQKIIDYCLSKKGASHDFPFDEVTMVFRVCNKMFGLINVDNEAPSINLKCIPEYSIELRDKYDAVIPGYHMNKKHWNTVDINSDLAIDEIFKLIDLSYQLVYDSLPKKVRESVK